MSRARYRGGKAPILTPTQLSERLPVPIYLMVSGFAGPFFPSTSKAAPSSAVMVYIGSEVPVSFRDHGSYFPMYFHWTQWRDIVVPVVEDPRITSWAGKLNAAGDALTLPVDIYGPAGTVVIPEGTSEGTSTYVTGAPSGLYRGDVDAYLTAVQSLILQKANEVAG